MKNNERYLNCRYLDAGMDGMLCSRSLCTTCKEFNGEKCDYYTSKVNDKEKKIDKSWRSKMVEKGMYKDNILTSQIQEMAKVISGSTALDTTKYYNALIKAKKCYEIAVPKDYIVISKTEKEKLLHEIYEQGRFDAIADLEKEGKVVMSREEYETWFKKDGYFLGYRDGENSAVNYYETLALPSKEMETAEKIYKEYLCNIFSLEAKEEFAKQFNVDIKE